MFLTQQLREWKKWVTDEQNKTKRKDDEEKIKIYEISYSSESKVGTSLCCFPNLAEKYEYASLSLSDLTLTWGFGACAVLSWAEHYDTANINVRSAHMHTNNNAKQYMNIQHITTLFS